MELKRVIRLDSTPLNRAFFTDEGYLIDTPILTSTGIFEYSNSDGSVRRELRLPDEVFNADSLASYMAKPIIVTHDVGLVNKDNVLDNEIGTILSEGYRDGDNVRAKIVIHGTDEMKESGLKELSLGYNLDLDETPGTYNGQHYDAIQRNIRINHLALVREARAGDKARLNIDSRDATTLKGVKVMSTKKARAKRSDGVLSPDELKKAIEEYKARHAAKDAEEEPMLEEKPVEVAEEVAVGAEEMPDMPEEPEKKDEDEEAPIPGLEELRKTIQHQDEDIQSLLDIIDTLLAEKDFKESAEDAEDVEENMEDMVEEEEAMPDEEEPMPDEEERGDADEEEEVVMEEAAEEEAVPEEPMAEDVPEEENVDSDDDPIPDMEDKDLKPGEVMNADSIDKFIRERIKLGILGEKLNLDGINDMPIRDAKKAVIKAVRPTINLDGKGKTYINAMFDLACDDVNSRTVKDTNYQRKQMFNGDSKSVTATPSAETARQKMIERSLNKTNKEDK